MQNFERFRRLGALPQTPKTASPIANFWLRTCLQRHILKTLSFGSSPLSLATPCLSTYLGPKLLIFDSKIFLSYQNTILLKISDDIIMHVIYQLVFPN